MEFARSPAHPFARSQAFRVTSPREAALRILAARIGPEPQQVETSVPLASFQREAVARATEIIKQRRGVLIADSVGLGKTFVALALIEAALAREERVLVVVPASLRRMWRGELRKLPIWNGQLRQVPTPHEGLSLVSHTALALRPPPVERSGLVVVDEAHAFRNPRTRRYHALRNVCRGANVVLLTATPVNNSLADLYFQLSLFCADGAFRDIGIGSLRSVLMEGNSLRDAEFARLRRAIMVRRTRAQIRGSGTDGFHFPAQVLMAPVAYGPPMSAERIGDLLGRLSFVAYRIEAQSVFSPEILRFGLLKRMESSAFAIRSTLQRQIRFYEQLLDALGRGLLLRPRAFRRLYQPNDDSLQLVLEPLALEVCPVGVSARIIEEARTELATLREWHAALAVEDDKLRALLSLLAARPRAARTIVFTEFRDTARYLWRALRRRFAVGLIDGSGASIGETPASRRQVLERFAPLANGARVHEREAIRVLVATDVLAEGMNLQDADVVISYDLPWNPIRLIQRAGRVDRIGSPHDVVSIYNFIPDRDFDAFLGLARTIRAKLETVRQSVGLEQPVLEPEADFEHVARALRDGDSGVLDRIEQADETLEDAVRPQLASLEKVDWTPVATLPGATGRQLLVAMARGHEWSIALIDPATLRTHAHAHAHPNPALPGHDAESAGDRILERALADDVETEVAPDVIDIAERYAATGVKGSTTMDRRSPAARLARLIRAKLSELPLDEPSDVYALADEVLEGLANVSDFDVERKLEGLVAGAAPSLLELLIGAKKALCASENQRRPSEGWHVTGVIVAD